MTVWVFFLQEMSQKNMKKHVIDDNIYNKVKKKTVRMFKP